MHLYEGYKHSTIINMALDLITHISKIDLPQQLVCMYVCVKEHVMQHCDAH